MQIPKHLNKEQKTTKVNPFKRFGLGFVVVIGSVYYSIERLIHVLLNKFFHSMWGRWLWHSLLIHKAKVAIKLFSDIEQSFKHNHVKRHVQRTFWREFTYNHNFQYQYLYGIMTNSKKAKRLIKESRKNRRLTKKQNKEKSWD